MKGSVVKLWNPFCWHSWLWAIWTWCDYC